MQVQSIRQVLIDVERYMREGYSIGLARRMAIGGKPVSHKTEVALMRNPLYVSMLNRYMQQIGKPINYVLVETAKGPRLTKLNRNKPIAEIPTTLPYNR